MGSFWPKVGGQQGPKVGVNEAKSWGPMVEVNKGQRLASTRPKLGVNEAKIWGQ